MTIWILAVLLLVSVALAGWRQGAIRAAFSFVGILVAAWLAVAVGGLLQPLLPSFGVGNPILAWAITPVIGFVLISVGFKIVAVYVHRRVELFYKYKAGDLRLALWERLNSRLGICLGLANGAAYFILVIFLIFNLAYTTTQVAVASGQPAIIRLVNQLGQDLEATGVAKAAAGRWQPVNAASEYAIRKTDPVKVTFAPVTTKALRLEIQLPKDFSAGLYEWAVE